MQTSLLDANQSVGVDFHQRTTGQIGYESYFHSHVEFEIYYFHGGECHYFINDRIYRLSPGDMIVMHGLTLHRPNPNLYVPYDRTKVHFKPEFLKDLINQLKTIDLYLPFHQLKNTRINLKHREDELERIFRDIHYNYNRRKQAIYNVRLRIYLLELLTLIYQTCGEQLVERDTELGRNNKVDNVQKVINYIEDHYCDKKLTLGSISNKTYLSKFYISRIFKEVTGAGLTDYITIKRINRAKHLLLCGKSVTEASFEVGYKHPAHFSRVFKQIVGMTADGYRKRNEYV